MPRAQDPIKRKVKVKPLPASMLKSSVPKKGNAGVGSKATGKVAQKPRRATGKGTISPRAPRSGGSIAEGVRKITGAIDKLQEIKPKTVGAGSVRKKGGGGGVLGASQLAANSMPGGTRLAAGAAKDAIDIPVNVVPSTVQFAKEAVHDPKKAARDLANQYADLRKPSTWLDHPLGSALMVSGAEAVPGRGVTAAMRVAPIKSVRKAASLERPPRVVEGTNLVQKRTYSKDIFVRAAQKKADKKAGIKPMSSKEQARRMDERVAANEDIRRINRARTVKSVEKTVPRKHGTAVVLAAQNIVKPTKADLETYLAEIRANRPTEPALVKAHDEAVKNIEKAIRHFDEKKVAEGAAAYRKLSVKHQDELVKSGLLNKDQAVRARLTPYALRHMGAKWDGKRIIGATGEELSNAAIRSHMAKHGFEEPAFITHAPHASGGRNFYVSQYTPPRAIGGAKRTGAGQKVGAINVHGSALTEGAARAQGLVDAAKGYTDAVKEAAQRRDGKLVLGNYRKMRRIADNHNASGGVPMRPVRLVPFAASKEQVAAALQRANNPTELARMIEESLSEAPANTKGQWVNIPEEAAKRLQEHSRTLGRSPLLRAYGSTFRTVVLSTSPTWLAGNIVEGALRSAVGRAGPRSFITGRRFLRSIEQQGGNRAGAEAASRMAGGGHYSLRARVDRHVNPDQVAADTAKGKMLNAVEQVRSAPGPKQVIGLWHRYTDFVFNSLNGRYERGVQTAMLGRVLRDHPLMEPHVLKLSQKAIDQAAKGALDPNVAAQLGREVDRMYGKYAKFSPEMRMWVSTYTPFIAWTLSSARFVFDVLPRDHPVMTGLLVSIQRAEDEWRKQHGLGMFVDNHVPGFLQGSVPGKGGSHLRLSRYTPFGAFADDGSYLGTLANALLPQAMSIYMPLAHGEDWKGTRLPTIEQQYKAAGDAFLSAIIPAYGQAKRVSKKGPQALLPFDYTQGKPKKVKATSGSGFGGGQSSSQSGFGGADNTTSSGFGG